MSLLVIMGSGETAPPLVRTHREIFDAVGAGGACMLDTPFAFQTNVDDLTARTQAYFSQTVGQPITVARWRTADAPLVEREAALAALAEARWVFAGPGSPTFALRQWHGTPLPSALAEVVRRGGAVVAGSAAAVTVGTHAVPVYEIYKAGIAPHWADGLDLLGTLTGIRAAVIPHFDNAEGGTHDTRFCYLGETRLAHLEAQLPADVGVLGVDEHTALLLDLDAGVVGVRGNGTVTVRREGQVTVVPDGLALDELAGLLAGRATAAVTGAASAQADAGDPSAQPAARADPAGSRVRDTHGQDAAAVGSAPAIPSLRAETTRWFDAFTAARADADVDGCVAAILELDDAIAAWATDMLQSDDADHARRTLRAMVVALGDLAREGVRDPAEVLGPFIDLVADVRAARRADGDYATADDLRDRLAALGVELRDGRDGSRWVLHPEAGGSTPDALARPDALAQPDPKG